MRLCLQADSYVLNWARDDRVGNTGECTGEVILPVTEIRRGVSGSQVSSFQPAAGVVEAAELNRDAGTDT